jgi:hypothetical protein
VDRFSGMEAWHRFLGEQGTAYAELDARCAELTRSETDLLA